MPIGAIGGPTTTVWEVEYDPSRDVWKVQKQGARRALKNFDTKQPAIEMARRKARNSKPARLNILNKSGRIVEQPTYG